METARASAATQLMFGHPPDLLLALSRGAEWQNGIVTLSRAIMEGRYVPPDQAIIPQSSGILPSPDLAISAHSIANVIKTDILPEFSLHINRAISESYGSVLSILSPKHHHPQAGSLHQTIRVHTHPFLLQRLRHFRSTEDSLLGFTGAAQAEVTQLMFDGQSNIGYFAATGEYLTSLCCGIALSNLSPGSGKTTPALLNATLDQGKSTVWCLPLKSMHEQYHLRCESHSMTCETWTRITSPDHPPLHILVTIEHTDSHRFHDFMSRLVAIRNLARVVVDEAHFALTHDSFRSIMSTLAWLGSVNCQIVLLSATVGPSLVEALFETFGITQYVICRQKTTRPNISYNVIRSPHPHQTLDSLVRKCLAPPGSDKAIVYCRSREETESTAKRLDLPFCHGSMPLSEINTVLNLLRTGQARAVVCTTVLGAALDLWELKWVFHLDHPYDMISYIQESGRVGRNPNMPAFSYVIVPQYSTPRHPTPDRFGAKLIYDWARDSKSCRRWLMHLFNDGLAEPCSMTDRVSNLCDVCRAAQSVRPDRGIPSTPSADVIKRYLPLTSRQ
jgi:Helicase conserved C-terminal domain